MPFLLPHKKKIWNLIKLGFLQLFDDSKEYGNPRFRNLAKREIQKQNCQAKGQSMPLEMAQIKLYTIDVWMWVGISYIY